MGVENQIYDATSDGSQTFCLYVSKYYICCNTQYVYTYITGLLDSREIELQKFDVFFEQQASRQHKLTLTVQGNIGKC